MRAAMSLLNVSARAYHRILKLARTIADLTGSADIQSAHLGDALQYRPELMMGNAGGLTIARLPFTTSMTFI